MKLILDFIVLAKELAYVSGPGIIDNDLCKCHGKATTQFMAAKLTDYAWSISEVLSFDTRLR